MQEIFGPYQLIERLAAGGMAEIFKARTFGQSGFEKILAIKRLHPRYTEHPEFVEMLKEEAKIAVGLSHSNIVQIFDLGRVQEHFYIAMEYLNGRDLNQTLNRLKSRQETFPIEATLYVISEICAGLDYAHRRRDDQGNLLRLVHRDISPQNIMISREGEVKIVDFGIAKSRASSLETEAGVLKGKFCFMSPEQAYGHRLDHRADIFSAGILMYELLTGLPMYEEQDDVTLLQRVRQAKFTPIEQIRPDLPSSIIRVLKKALKHNRDDRFASARHFQYALEKAAQKSQLLYTRFQLNQLMLEIFPEFKQPQKENYIQNYSDFEADDLSLISDYEISRSGEDHWDVPDLTDEFIELDEDDMISLDEIIPLEDHDSEINQSVLEEHALLGDSSLFFGASGQQEPSYTPQRASYSPQEPSYSPQEPSYSPQEVAQPSSSSQAPYIPNTTQSPPPQATRLPVSSNNERLDSNSLYSNNPPSYASPPQNNNPPSYASPPQKIAPFKYPPAAPYINPNPPQQSQAYSPYSAPYSREDVMSEAPDSTMILDQESPQSKQKQPVKGASNLLQKNRYGQKSSNDLRDQVNRQYANVFSNKIKALIDLLTKQVTMLIQDPRGRYVLVGVSFLLIFLIVRSLADKTKMPPISSQQLSAISSSNQPVRLGDQPVRLGDQPVRLGDQQSPASQQPTQPFRSNIQNSSRPTSSNSYPSTALQPRTPPSSFQQSPPTTYPPSQGQYNTQQQGRGEYPQANLNTRNTTKNLQQNLNYPPRSSDRSNTLPSPPINSNNSPFMFELSTDPPGAEIAINEDWQTQTTPITVRVVEGTPLNITYSLAGYVELQKTVWPERSKPRSQVILQPQRGQLIIRTFPSKAKIRVNQQYLGESPINEQNFPLLPTELTIQITKPGFQKTTQRINWSNAVRGTLTLEVKLTENVAPPKKVRKKRPRKKRTRSRPKGSGYISVQSKKWGHVYIDNQFISETPVFKKRVKAGVHRIKLCYEGNRGNCVQELVKVTNESHKKQLFY